MFAMLKTAKMEQFMNDLEVGRPIGIPIYYPSINAVFEMVST